MASTAYTNGLEGLMDNVFDYTSTIKSMLLKNTYPEDPDQAFVDDGSANDLASHECDATGYTGGFNGADRLTTALTTTEQTASNRVVVIPADKTWTAIGGVSNNTLEGVALIFEVTNDAASIPVVFLLFSVALTTNGSDILVDFDGTDGNLRFTV
jgi:hypothetical protein